MDEDEQKTKKVEEEPPRRRPKKLKFPRRAPSIIPPQKKIVFITADKLTCTECPCYPPEDPYAKPKLVPSVLPSDRKLKPCQMTPLTLYELAAAVVDELMFPEAYNWSEEEVAEWMANDVGLPQYKDCILDNHINGRRLLYLEDPSQMPKINIRYMDHILMITAKVRQIFRTDFIRFTRSVGLPPRKPLTHCTWFKSRTGPTWGIRQNWDRSDILRWMKIIDANPLHLDHWDLVWYWPPDFPKNMFARIPPASTHGFIPHYKLRPKPPCREYLTSRKFRLQHDIPAEQQLIWMEHRPGSPVPKETVLAKKREAIKKMPPAKRSYKPTVPKATRLDPPKIDLTGKSGKDLILARRLMPRKKFMVT